MKWVVKKSRLSGSVNIPPSKSHTIRALLVSILSSGESKIHNPLMRGDGESAIKAAAAMGINVDKHSDTINVSGTAAQTDDTIIDCGNSGTTMRLFTSAAALGSASVRFSGDASLKTRPMRPLLNALSNIGAKYSLETPDNDVPFTIKGPISGGYTEIDGITSQFLSSLLLSCPLAVNNTVIKVKNLQEKSYVEITLWWLKKMGIDFTVSPDFDVFTIKGGQTYPPVNLTIPSDFSSATFAAVGSLLTESDVLLHGLDFTDRQGDKEVFKILKDFGAMVNTSGSETRVTGAGTITGVETDLNSMPDSLPALSVLGCRAEGTTRLVNVPQARIKETDRISVMTSELGKMGANIKELNDGMIISHSNLIGTRVNGHHDHRVIMSLALAGMIAEGETIIDTAESADVTYPGFVEDFKALGADIKVVDN